MADPKALYDALFQDKLYTKTYGEFIIQFAGDKAREELYTTLSSDKLYTKSLDEFNEQFFDVKKKEVSEVGGTPSEISGEVQQPLPSELEKPDLTLQTPQFRKEEIPNYIEKGAEIPRPVPKVKTLSDYVGAFAGTIDEGLADMVDMVDYLGTGTQDAIYQIMFGKETANAVSKLRKEGMLPTTINPPRLTEGISQVLRYAGRHKELPKDTKLQKITSGVLEGTAGVIPPILATFIAPEIKLPAIFQKLGLKQLSKFGTVIGTEEGVRTMETTEEGTTLEKLTLPVLQGLEGFATGMTFDALGAMSSKIGIKIADKILPVTKTTSQIINKALLQTSATSLTNATFFGGYGNLEEYLTTGKISAETFATNFGMGLALGLREPGRLLYTKGINTLISTPIEIINKTIQNDLTSEQLAKQAQEKIDNVESGQSANKELDIISAKILANASILKSTTEEIIKNPDDVITSIKESELDPKLQETIIDKVNEVVVENEPNAEEKKPIREKLRAIEEEFENIKNNKSLTKAERDIKQEKLTAKIEQFKTELLAVKAKPKKVEKEEVISESEKKEEVPQEVSEPKVEEVKPTVELGEKVPVTKGEKGILDIKEENAFTIPITQAGKDIGSATIENLPEGWRIKWIDVEGARKTGAGREAMRLLNQQANKEGKVLISDIEGKNTAPMVRAWEKLIESGEAEQTPDGLWRMKPTEPTKVTETKPTIGNWEKGEERPFAFDENSTKNEGRFRLFPPENIKKDTYFSRNSSTEGVRYIMGKTKDGKEIIQAIRFDKGRFTEEQAKNWFEKNKSKYKFYSTEKILIEPQITPKETVSPVKGEIVPPTEKVAETSIFVAPWESKKVKDFNDESGFKETQYKEFQDVLSKIAQSMGYPIKKTNRTIGGWFSGKEKIHEPSVGVVIPTQNQEDIDLFSSLAGALAPQTQNSVIRIRVKKGEVGDWTEITPKDIDAVNKITDKLKKLGFSLEKDNNKLYIGTQNINELNNLYEILEKNGTGITGIRTRQASVSFFDKGSYLPTLERYGDRSHRRYGGVGGENLYNYVTQATTKLRGEEVKLPKVQEPSLKEREAEIKPAKGIKYQDKTYVSVEDIQEDFDKFESLQEYNKILEKVRKFEDGLKADAIKTSDETAKKLGIVDRVTEEKRLGEVNDRLNIKLLPDIPAIANDILYKQLVKVRDGLANTTANLLQKGMKSQNDILRWMSKFITNWWGGLGRTQADIHGKEGKIGKLEMKGTTQVFALYEAKQIRGKMLELVNDPESLRRVRDAYDLEIAEEKIKFEDLTIVEQNLYNLIKDWNTWVWSTNYALGIIPTESHLKYLDTENEGKSTYIARMYDKWEIDELPPEINEHITKGSNSVTTKMITDYLKARKEVDDWKKEHAITDPTYLTTKRIMQTIQNVAIKEYMDAVISEHPDFVLELKKGQEVPKGYKKLGSSWGWGQFRNKAVINHIVEDFTGFFYANKLTNVLYDALKLWDRNKINQFYKKFRTLYNPMVQLGNMTGDVFFASINGINPAEFLAEQITVLRDRVSKVDEDVYKSVLKSGLMGDVGITGDMTPPKESIKDLTTAKTSWGRIKEILHKGDELASDLYIGTDNVAKYAAYRVFRKRGFTHAQALRRAYDAFQNYMTVGKTWDVASKLPVIGPTFVKFQADLQRIITNAILTTPLTAIGTVMLIKLFGILTSHLSGESDEEREEREKRKGVAKIPIINVPLSFKIGKAELNGARYLSPLYIYKQEDSESDLAEFSKYLPLQFVKATAPQLDERKNVIAFGDATWGWLGSVMADRDFRSISIRNPEATIFFNPNITTDQKIANVMNYVFRSQLPFYKSFEDITDGITGKLDYYGRKRTWYQAIMNGIIKIQEFDDPELKRYIEGNIKYLTNKFAGLSEAMGDANALFLKELQKAEDLGISKEAMDKLYKVEDKRRAKNMEQSLKEQIPVLQEIERQVNVYKKWYPDDPFIKENFMNIEAGKNRIFDIKSDIDFQKKYKEEYNLLKKNGLIKKPDEIPTAYKGIKLNEEQRREYIATYWSEYVRYLDAKMGLTQENIDKYKSKITKIKKVKTKLEPEIMTALDEKVSRAREEARDKAEKRLKQTIKNQ